MFPLSFNQKSAPVIPPGAGTPCATGREPRDGKNRLHHSSHRGVPDVSDLRSLFPPASPDGGTEGWTGAFHVGGDRSLLGFRLPLLDLLNLGDTQANLQQLVGYSLSVTQDSGGMSRARRSILW
jgi:hypothetical protein